MPSKPSIIPSGAILVVPPLSPEWFPYLTPTLGGVISEAGSLMSHGAIQCRERGIPAIFGVVGATHRIQAGELIAIDGKKGSVLHVGERDDKWL
jgi:pyruvate,water dikinase